MDTTRFTWSRLNFAWYGLLTGSMVKVWEWDSAYNPNSSTIAWWFGWLGKARGRTTIFGIIGSIRERVSEHRRLRRWSLKKAWRRAKKSRPLPVTGHLWGRFNDPLMRSTDHAQPLHKFIFSCNKYIVRFRGQLSISWSLECVEQKKLPENWGQPDQIAFATGFIPGRIHRVLLVHGPSDLPYIIPVSAFSNLHELD